MVDDRDSHTSDPASIRRFLERTLPFHELPAAALDRLAVEFRVDFFPKGMRVLRQGESPVDFLHIVRSGGVKVYFTDPQGAVTLKDFRGEGAYFGALGILRDSKANFSVETVEDTFCLFLPKEMFRRLLREHTSFAGYFLKSFSEELIDTAYSALRVDGLRGVTEDRFHLFTLTAADVIKRLPESITGSESAQAAAKRMSVLGVGSLLVTDPGGETVGILTTKDLRARIVSAGLDYSTHVSDVMSSPLHAIPADAGCFAALLTMMRLNAHHLPVRRGDAIIGVVTAHDLMVHQSASPVRLLREIQTESRIEGLHRIARNAPYVVKSLVEQGAKANDICKVITVINDHIAVKLIGLIHAELGPEPCAFSWITFGSEGRKEQTFKTDQDNALIYETPAEDPESQKIARMYFRTLAAQVITHLEQCGYPPCPGRMMASNAKWRKPYVVWKNYFEHWMTTPEPQQMLHAKIFFDFRHVFGHHRPAGDLRDYLTIEAPERGLFLMHLAKDCLSGKAPLTFFRNFVVEKDGEHKNRLDLKTRGLVPFVDFARVMALKHGIKETNTLTRLRLLDEAGHIPHELYTETRDAYEFQMQLRLVGQLRMLDRDEPPHNYIDPAELSEPEKQTLKQAFSVIDDIRSYVRDEFRVVE